MGLFNFFRQELAIDLGTANTLIIKDGEVVVDEPSIVAINRKSGETIAVGSKAMQMHEKTHENIKTIRPLKDGVIADFQAEDGIRDSVASRGLGDVYKRQSPSFMMSVLAVPRSIANSCLKKLNNPILI